MLVLLVWLVSDTDRDSRQAAGLAAVSILLSGTSGSSAGREIDSDFFCLCSFCKYPNYYQTVRKNTSTCRNDSFLLAREEGRDGVLFLHQDPVWLDWSVIILLPVFSVTWSSGRH